MTELVPTSKPWMADAACRNHHTAPPDYWHASGWAAQHQTREAKRICRQECPVVMTCLSENLHEKHGVWGATDEAQRDTLRRKANRRRRTAS